MVVFKQISDFKNGGGKYTKQDHVYYVDYIATRIGAVYGQGMEHGLFGRYGNTNTEDNYADISNLRDAEIYVGEMRSGYGINLRVDPWVYTNGKNGDVTTAQNAIATFPEFNYESYNRVMELVERKEFALRENVYSMYKAPVHFTPIWYPDDAEYAPQTKIIDIWTPGGQMYVYSDDALIIRDGTYFDDWHIAPKLVRE